VAARAQPGEAARGNRGRSRREPLLEVVSGAEGDVAAAGDDRHALLGIGRKGIEQIRQCLMARKIERVARLGAIDREDRDRAVAPNLDALDHACTRLSWRRAVAAAASSRPSTVARKCALSEMS